MFKTNTGTLMSAFEYIGIYDLICKKKKQKIFQSLLHKYIIINIKKKFFLKYYNFFIAFFNYYIMKLIINTHSNINTSS